MAAPLWRRVFDRVERRLGEPLEIVIATPEAAMILGLGARLQRGTGQTIDQAFAWWLHQWGMPARRDVLDVARSVTRVERRLRDVSQQIEALKESIEQDKPKPE
jgi:hypothetical protein